VGLAKLVFPLLQSQQEWEHGSLPSLLAKAQADIACAGHLLLIFPLWLGDMPLVLRMSPHRWLGMLRGVKATASDG